MMLSRVQLVAASEWHLRAPDSTHASSASMRLSTPRKTCGLESAAAPTVTGTTGSRGRARTAWHGGICIGERPGATLIRNLPDRNRSCGPASMFRYHQMPTFGVRSSAAEARREQDHNCLAAGRRRGSLRSRDVTYYLWLGQLAARLARWHVGRSPTAASKLAGRSLPHSQDRPEAGVQEVLLASHGRQGACGEAGCQGARGAIGGYRPHYPCPAPPPSGGPPPARTPPPPSLG